MPENPRRAERDEYAAGGKEAASTRFQCRVHRVQTALPVAVDRAGDWDWLKRHRETGFKLPCNTRIEGKTRTQDFYFVAAVMLQPPVARSCEGEKKRVPSRRTGVISETRVGYHRALATAAITLFLAGSG